MSKVFILANDESTIYNFRLELVKQLISDKYEVIIAFPRGGERTNEIIDLGCHFIDLPMKRKGKNIINELKLINNIAKHLKKCRPDVLLTFTIKPNLYGGLVAQFLDIRQIANITGLGSAVEKKSFMQKVLILLYKFCMRKTECIFFQNEENRDFLQSKGIALKTAKLLPGSGVNLDRFKLLDYPDDKVIKFYYIGRVMKEKGIEQFLAVAKDITGKYPNIEFHVVGPCEENYVEILDQYQKIGFIKYHSEHKDIRKFYADMHCLIHPSSYPEGMSNVLLEAAASGRPCITTNRSGCKEIVDDGINGFVLIENDYFNLKITVEKFLNMDYNNRKIMGLAGREKVEKYFDRQIVMNAYLDEINSCAEDY